MATPSDAFVFFGATGDLAYKQIFPALQAHGQAGTLDMPVIGVAKAGWDLDQLKKRAQDSLEEHGGDRPRRVREADDAAALRRRRLRRPGHVRAPARGARPRAPPAALPRDPAERCSAPSSQALGDSGCAPTARASSSRSRSAATWPPPRRSTATLHARLPRGRDLPHRPLPRQGAGRRTSSTSASPTRFLEPIWNRNHVEQRADHDGRELRRPGPRRVLRRGRRDPRRGPEPHAPGRRAAGDGAAGRPGRRGHPRRARRELLRAIAPLDAADVVRGQFRGYRDEPGVARTRRSRPSPRCGLHIDLALGRRALPHPRRQVPARDGVRGARAVQPAAGRRLPRRAPSSSTPCASASSPTSRSAWACGPRRRARAASARTIELHRPGESPPTTCRPTSGCSATRSKGDAGLFARQDYVEAAWQVVDPILGDVVPVDALRPGHRGGRRRRPRIPPRGDIWHDPDPPAE